MEIHLLCVNTNISRIIKHFVCEKYYLNVLKNLVSCVGTFIMVYVVGIQQASAVGCGKVSSSFVYFCALENVEKFSV